MQVSKLKIWLQKLAECHQPAYAEGQDLSNRSADPDQQGAQNHAEDSACHQEKEDGREGNEVGHQSAAPARTKVGNPKTLRLLKQLLLHQSRSHVAVFRLVHKTQQT